jgi:carboxyl-terminal processing protease
VSIRTPLAKRRQTVMLVWAGLSVAAVALAACAGGQSGADGSPTGLYGRGLDQIANLYIEPISTRRVALAGIARLSRIDDRLAVSDSGDTSRGRAFGLNYDGHSVAFYSMPADGNNRDWGELVGSLVATARGTSPKLAALPEETVEKAVFDGITGALDHYSRYATPKTAREQRAERDGYSGVGVTLEAAGESFRVASLCAHGPAEKAGIRVNDSLLAVDGIPTAGRAQESVMEDLRGPIGSNVAVSLLRSGAAQPRDLQLRRAFVTLPTVTMSRNGNIAVFRIASFNQSTTERLAEELAEARRQAGGQLAGIVLDLRGDPGGLLDQAVSLADLFVHDGPIASTTGRHPASHQSFAASGRAVASQVPIVVLINGGSASASEIVAAALQDRGRAVVIGSSSFGKGTVQTVMHLPNDGELILTWARLVTPSGYLLQSHGVVPTVCTSGLGDDEASVQSALQRVGGSASTARSRAGLDEHGWAQLRQSCPGRETKPAVDLKVAERLLGDPQLYSQALHMMRTASLASGAPGAP